MRLLFLTLTMVVASGLARAQTKFDSYARLITTDDEAARLDAFCDELHSHPSDRGYLVGYNDAATPPGVFLRRLYGDQTYLIEARGVEPGRILVIEGGYRDKLTTELWVVPPTTIGPPVTPNGNIPARTKPFLFDEQCLECSPPVFLDLFGLGPGLKFYAVALRDATNTHAVIIVRPGHETSARQALVDARGAKRRLVRQYRIASNRIRIRLTRRRKDNMATAEMWLIPGGAK
jgi:hypothetical protein